MQQLDENLWTIDGPLVNFLGLDFPTRMTIARTGSSLWVHSPIPITSEIEAFIAQHGEVDHVVAPNNLHHLYLDGWQKRYPDARYYAAPGLSKKRSDLRFDDELLKDQNYPWSEHISHSIFEGNRFFEEVVFFHQPSKTLILTDLIVNTRIDDFNPFQKWFARFDRVAYPTGASPRTFRWGMRDWNLGKRCYEQMVAWEPSKIVISHGECFLENGTVELKARLGWVDR